jgi:hypothetical protein
MQQGGDAQLLPSPQKRKSADDNGSTKKKRKQEKPWTDDMLSHLGNICDEKRLWDDDLKANSLPSVVDAWKKDEKVKNSAWSTYKVDNGKIKSKLNRLRKKRNNGAGASKYHNR